VTLARLLPDLENPNWNCMSRTDPRNPKCVRGLAGRQAPQTVRYHGETGQVTLTPRYRNLFERWNTPEAIKYNDRNGGGWHNKGSSVQQVLFGGNIVQVVDVIGTRVYFEHYALTVPPVRDLRHRFTVVTPDGETVLPPCGDLWIFPITRKIVPVYFNVSDVELVEEQDDPPAPPAEQPYNVIALRRTVLRQQPRESSGQIAPAAIAGELFTVYTQQNGWGYTGQRGWIWLSDVRKA